MTVSLPFKPAHSIEWLEEFFSKNFYKKPYDRFMWWRSYTPKNKPLPYRALLIDKIKNGDFDLSPFLYEAEIVEHRLNQKYAKLINDPGRFEEETAVDKARRKRLLEDFEKDESKKLNDLYKEFSVLIGISAKDVENELAEFDGELIDFFHYITEKFPRENGIPYL